MNSSLEQVAEGVEVVNKAGEVLEKIIELSARNDNLINDISSGVKQTSGATENLAASAEQVSSTIQQLAGASQNLSQMAENLRTLVEKFKV